MYGALLRRQACSGDRKVKAPVSKKLTLLGSSGILSSFNKCVWISQPLYDFVFIFPVCSNEISFQNVITSLGQTLKKQWYQQGQPHLVGRPGRRGLLRSMLSETQARIQSSNRPLSSMFLFIYPSGSLCLMATVAVVWLTPDFAYFLTISSFTPSLWFLSSTPKLSLLRKQQ